MSTTSPVADPQTPVVDGTSQVGRPLDAPTPQGLDAPQPLAPPLYVPTPTVEPKAFSVASLVLGIASLAFGYTVIVPIVGLVLGILALKREPSNKAMSWWGIALSGLSLAGGIIAVLLGVALIVPLGLAGVFAG